MLKIDNLSFCYNRNQKLLQNLNFSSEERVIGIIGKNGSGKSTLLKLITKELAPDSGSAKIKGRVYRVEHQFDFYKKFTISELLSLLEELTSFDTTKAPYVVSGLQISSFLDQPLSELSQGTYKKVGLLIGMLSNAETLLFDEPFESIDIVSREFVAQFISNTSQQIILVDHDTKLVGELSGNVLNLDEW